MIYVLRANGPKLAPRAEVVLIAWRASTPQELAREKETALIAILVKVPQRGVRAVLPAEQEDTASSGVEVVLIVLRVVAKQIQAQQWSTILTVASEPTGVYVTLVSMFQIIHVQHALLEKQELLVMMQVELILHVNAQRENTYRVKLVLPAAKARMGNLIGQAVLIVLLASTSM